MRPSFFFNWLIAASLLSMKTFPICNSISPKTNAPLMSINGCRSFTCRANRVSMAGRPSSTSSNFYQVLALESENVGADAIKRAYRSMALRYHPDVCPASRKAEATRKFIEIKKAYEILSNPLLREKYDHQLALGLVDLGERREEERRAVYPREVWMEQLNELRARSMRKKRMGCSCS
ncbi:chaperone protein dnaJ 20, chloroplastic-like [Canna indica]|uniref:Chaperone protein dnaJ 20, chloroplastic-like n=1 Tax=Canna indica TaxID=4628 RepID=A0AAQ3PXU4_9LILI|nr:chaperone protein dnaJ 20, chloroplastic-like [Canna indica]